MAGWPEFQASYANLVYWEPKEWPEYSCRHRLEALTIPSFQLQSIEAMRYVSMRVGKLGPKMKLQSLGNRTMEFLASIELGQILPWDTGPRRGESDIYAHLFGVFSQARETGNFSLVLPRSTAGLGRCFRADTSRFEGA